MRDQGSGRESRSDREEEELSNGPKLSLGWLPVVIFPVGTILTGAIIGLTSLYYRDIGVNPEDLGVNITQILVVMVGTLFEGIGLIGPFLFISPFWRWATGWFMERQNPVSRWLAEPPASGATGDRKRIRYVRRILWWLTFFPLLFLTGYLAVLSPFIPGLLVAPIVIGLILVSVYGDAIGLRWRVPQLPVKWYAVGFAIFLVVLIGPALYVINEEAPDLQTDGAHGGLELRLLDVDGQPVLVRQKGVEEPFGMLRLGRADGTWVLFDPCTEVASYYSINDVTLEVIDEVACVE